MKWTVSAALLIACGGGPSVPGGDVDPSTRIISTNCQVLGANQVTVDVAYDTTLGVGNTWESEILVGGDLMTSEDQFFSCNAWTQTGSGLSAKGCQRDTADQPATQNVSHTYTANFQGLPTPVNVMIVANTFDSPSGLSEGNDFDNIDCF